MKGVKLLVGIPVATYSLYLMHNVQRNGENFSALINVKASQQRLQLEQVQILFRHGARTPIKCKEEFDNYSNLDSVVWDRERFMKVLPHVDINYVVKSINGDGLLKPLSHSKLVLLGGCGGGELTTIGQQEAYDFGQWLANEYVTKHGILSPIYKHNDVYVRSTLSKRAILTAVGVMAGLYGKDNLTESVLIHSAPNSSENICPNWNACRKVHKRFMYHWYEDKGQIVINKGLGLKEGVRPLNFIELFDIIAQRRHHGQSMPKFLLDNEEEVSKCAMETLLGILGTNVDELKNSIGSFVETICCRINEAIDGTCESKMIMYPSHDTTVISFLISLGIFDYNWPPFVANIIIELYRGEDDERFIRVLHNRHAVILDKESGEEYLPVEKFMKLVEKYRVVDWAEDCGNNVE